jgi:hypothetical protein
VANFAVSLFVETSIFFGFNPTAFTIEIISYCHTLNINSELLLGVQRKVGLWSSTQGTVRGKSSNYFLRTEWYLSVFYRLLWLVALFRHLFLSVTQLLR